MENYKGLVSEEIENAPSEVFSRLMQYSHELTVAAKFDKEGYGIKFREYYHTVKVDYLPQRICSAQ